MTRVSKYHSGYAALCCPHCKKVVEVGHMSWRALVCQKCKKMVLKTKWYKYEEK